MKRAILISLLLVLLFNTSAGIADAAATTLAGRILLQVESHGESWYISPISFRRYYLGRPLDAFNLMRQLSLGVSNRDFADWNGRAPRRLSGRFIIKPEDAGKAYYVYPPTLELYYLGRPQDAFNLMGRLGLGVTNAALARITIAPNSAIAPGTSTESNPPEKTEKLFPVEIMERSIFNLVNEERVANGLSPVVWNEPVAAVAREHSKNLAEENIPLIDDSKICGYPFIHHEGVVFGLHHTERLNNRQIYNFSSSAENIALIPLIKSTSFYSDKNEPLVDCQEKLDQLNQLYESTIQPLKAEADLIVAVKNEVGKRARLLAAERIIEVSEITWHNQTEVEKKTVAGWMNSPGHRANILNRDYTEAGIGIVRVKDYFVITQVFIKHATCGYKTGQCCEKAGFYPYCYLPLTCNNLVCQ